MGENKVDTSAEKILHELNHPSQGTRLKKGIVELLEYMPSRVRKRVHLDIPNFQEEYQQVYPQEREHVGILKDAFNHQKLYRFQELDLDNVPWNVGMFIKRYGDHSSQLMKFLQSDPKPGDIYKSRAQRNYPKQRYQIFRNAPIKETSFKFGKTYVFIGYVDLLQIMMGNVTGNGDKLIFHGFDQSEICVARSLVIYEMIKTPASLDSILKFGSQLAGARERWKNLKLHALT